MDIGSNVYQASGTGDKGSVSLQTGGSHGIMDKAKQKGNVCNAPKAGQYGAGRKQLEPGVLLWTLKTTDDTGRVTGIAYDIDNQKQETDIEFSIDISGSKNLFMQSEGEEPNLDNFVASAQVAAGTRKFIGRAVRISNETGFSLKVQMGLMHLPLGTVRVQQEAVPTLFGGYTAIDGQDPNSENKPKPPPPPKQFGAKKSPGDMVQRFQATEAEPNMSDFGHAENVNQNPTITAWDFDALKVKKRSRFTCHAVPSFRLIDTPCLSADLSHLFG